MTTIPAKPLISDQVTKGTYFFLGLTTNTHRPLTVHYGGRERCNPNYRIERKNFPHHAIEYVFRGKGQITLGKTSYPLLPGMVYAYTPDEYHLITTDPDDPMVKYFVCFAGKDVPALLQDSGLAVQAPAMLAQSRWIASNFDQLIDCGNARQPDTLEMCDLLLRLLLKRIRFDMLLESDVSSPSFQTYLSCRKRIEHEYLTLQSAGQVARQEHIDPAYLSRLFKRYTHESPYQLLLRLKMDHAAAILIHEHRSVKEAAATVGFSDPYHFSRVFKSKHGLSPTRFVKQSGIAPQ